MPAAVYITSMEGLANCHAQRAASRAQLAANGPRAAALAPFDELMGSRQRFDELAAASRPVIGQLCNFVPDELILACGAIPIRLDHGCRHAALTGSQLLRAEVCCAVQALAGAAAFEMWPFLDLVIVPAACDGKKKLAAQLARQCEVFVLELPFRRDREGMQRWYRELERLVKRLERITKRRLSKLSLKSAVILHNRRVEVTRALDHLRQSDPPRLSGIDMLLLMQAAFIADPSWWLEKAQLLLDELSIPKPNHAVGPYRARLLTSGSPILWPDFSLLNTIAKAGADIVADEMCSGTQQLYHPAIVDEWTTAGMFRACADRVVLPCTCPCFSENGARLDRLKELIASQRVAGVVLHTLRLCQLYDMDMPQLEAQLDQWRIPWLSLRSDMTSGDTASMRNRLEAFVEMVASHRNDHP